MNNDDELRAEEKRILKMAGILEAALHGVDTGTLSLNQVRRLLETAALLASAVLHEDTEITVRQRLSQELG